MNETEIIKTAHTDPEVQSLKLRSTRGEDESRRPQVVMAGGVNRTKAEGTGEAVATVQQVPLIALNDLGSAVRKSRLLCEGLWGRAFLTAYYIANDGERMRMAEGLGKGAGLALLTAPIVEALHLHAGPVSAYFVQISRPGRSDKRPAYPPLRRRRDACPHTRDG